MAEDEGFACSENYLFEFFCFTKGEKKICLFYGRVRI